MGNYMSRSLNGIFWVFLFTFLGYIFGYVTRTLLARNLSVVEYGLFYSVYSLVMFLTMFSYMGFGVPLVKFTSEFKAKKDYEKLTFSLIFPSVVMISLSLVMALLLFFASDYLALHYFKSVSAGLISKLFGLVLIGTVITHITLLIFKGFQDFFLVGLITFLEKASFTIFIVIFLLLGLLNNAYSAVYALILAFIFTILLSLPKLLSYRKNLVRFKFSSSLSKKIKNYAFASFIASLGLLIVGYIDTIMLTHFRTLEEVGVYNVVLPTVMVLSMFAYSMRHVLAPIVSELWAKGLKKKMVNGIEMVRNYSLVGIIPFILTLLIFPTLVINLLFTPKYASGALTMQILSVGMIFFTIGFTDLEIIRFIGKPKESTKIILIGVVFNIISNLILIPLFGMNGAAITTTLSYFIIMLMSSYKLDKFIQVKSSLIFWLKVIVSAILFILTATIIKESIEMNQFFEGFICLVAGSIVYVVFCFLFRVVEYQDIKKFLENFIKK